MKQSKGKNFVIFLGILIVIFFIFNIITTPVKKEITYLEFMEKLDAGEVEEVSYGSRKPTFTGVLVDGSYFKTDNPEVDGFKELLLNAGVTFKVLEVDYGSLFQRFLELIMFLALLYFFFMFLMRKQINIMDLDLVEKDIAVTFDDVAGNEEAKEDLMEIVDFLKNPKRFAKYGAKMPRGTLLEGPPGTGKTLLAKALAGTAGVTYLSLSGSDFVEKFVGVGASRVRQLFKEARENAPAIIFIDELDAIGGKRVDDFGGYGEKNQTLNQLLVEMDGFNPNVGIVVVAATNRIDTLDSALLRSGRFDRQIKVGLPDVIAREQILNVYREGKPVDKDLDMSLVAKMTVMLSGADLENLMNEASIYAAREDLGFITMVHIERAYSKLIAGEVLKRESPMVVKKITAIHEAGHAFMANYFGREVGKVSILSTTKGAGGYTLIMPEEGNSKTKRELKEDIMILYAGRVAEEVLLGSEGVTTGAISDLNRATKLVIDMVGSYGLYGNYLDLGVLKGVNPGAVEDVIVLADNESRRLMGESKCIVEANRGKVLELAELLYAEEVVYAEVLGKFFGVE